jgi:hypothetical protein
LLKSDHVSAAGKWEGLSLFANEDAETPVNMYVGDCPTHICNGCDESFECQCGKQ